MKKELAGLEGLPRFSYVEKGWGIIVDYLRFSVFKKLTANSCQLFMRGGDYISILPQISGVWEPALTKLIGFFVELGNDDFLIDVGANIGMTSCQNGGAFKEVHMFEPNPLCFAILGVNTQISLDPALVNVYPFGLGDVEKRVSLTVPKHNWGGGFVNDPTNSYGADVLVQKDGFSDFDPSKYYSIEILIKSAEEEFARLFSELRGRGRLRGVVKIDVEGYERTVLAGLAKALPEDFKVFVVFESWDSNFDMAGVLDEFGGRAVAYKLSRQAPWKDHWPSLLKGIASLFNRSIVTRLEEAAPGEIIGDVVLSIN